MGGDDPPDSNVAGAAAAASEDLHVLLVGDEAVLHDSIRKLGGLPPSVHVHHASEVVEMDDSPRSALRRKKDSSLRIAFELASNGQADAVVTMGNSGAALAMGMFVTGRLEGVLRPAIAALVPRPDRPVVLLDVGANVECRPEHLQQFGVMGAALSSVAWGIDRPRVAVLANGEEDGKGTELTRAASRLLSDSPGVEFAGYVEPRELLAGAADVVVTDGWTGNVALKTAEGVLEHATSLARDAIQNSLRAKAGAALLAPVLKRALGHLDHRRSGGGLLLGIDTCAVIGHGRADAEAVASAIRFADALTSAGLLERMRLGLGLDLSAESGGGAG